MGEQEMPVLKALALGALEDQEQNHYQLVNVDFFATFSYLSFEMAARHMSEYAADEVFSIHDLGEASDERRHFWVNASYVDQVLSHILEEYEGMPCCADKSRSLVKMYDEMLATGEEPHLPRSASAIGDCHSMGAPPSGAESSS